jgi:DNA-binding MurR/RpiR family transcriptional regulator
MADARHLVDAIVRRSKQLTPAERRVAEFVLRNPSQVAFLNAKQLGQAAKVSEASVVRFACCIGFKGYRELRASTQRVASSQLMLTQRYLDQPRQGDDVVRAVVRTNIRNMQGLAESLSARHVTRAAKRIVKARTCYVAGFRAAAGLALVASSAISQLCHNCVQLSFESGETVDQLVGAGPRDVPVVPLRSPAFSGSAGRS